jgi:hypothetical protein
MACLAISLSASNLPKSISTGAQYVTLDNKIKCLSLAVFFLASNPTNENCNWNCIYVGITYSKPPGPIIMINQSELLIQSNLLHSFLEVHNYVVPFTSHSKLHEVGAKKSIS